MAFGVRLVDERTAAGQPILDSVNGEEFMHVQPGVAIALGDRSPDAPGTLYITTKQVVWLSDVDGARGYAVDFLSISLHAVSRDPEAYPSPCIYAQIETGADEDDSEGSDLESNEPHDLSSITEMRLVPSDPSQLDNLFEIFCECAELNPEPIDDVEDEEHNWIFSADQLEGETLEVDDSDWPIPEIPDSSIGYSNGNHDLASSVLQVTQLASFLGNLFDSWSFFSLCITL
uniref:Chloride conductance regulatory protein ICln n=1 Tax=Kalanchoe fedtschenkoi TaxID=63787 RepID=A0A7N0V4K2_KALFE